MIRLETFTFTVRGQSFNVEAVNHVQAFSAANLKCEQEGIDLPQGVWETGIIDPRMCRWIEGNFFD